MKTYVRIVDGQIAEFIPELLSIDGRDRALKDRYPQSFIARLVEYNPTNLPDPTPDPTPSVFVPQAITMRQARLALLAAGKLAMVDEAIAAMPSPQKEAAEVEWNYSSVVERSSSIVALLEPALELDAAALDQMFIEAFAL